MNLKGLRPFFEPTGVAIVGATRTPGFGYLLPLRLIEQGWGDRLYLVNPKGGTMHGLTVYPRVAEVPDPVDLAVLMTSAAAAPQALREIGQRGIKCVVVESAGFAETGEPGKALQSELSALAAEFGLRVIGPNCVGVVNTANRFTTVEVVAPALTPGPLGIIAQSGVFGNVLLDGLHERGLFISKAITLGNRMDVTESEALAYLHQDPFTRVIMMYLEGAADGRVLRDTLARVTRDKPVLALKSGRTSAGRLATSSHTGSLSGEDALYDAVFAQTGTIRAGTLEELIALARVFTTQPWPRGPKLGIVTSSGSLGALAADAAVAAGLTLASLSPETIAAVREGAPPWMNVKNPLDVGPSGLYAKALPAIMADPEVDLVLAVTIIPFAVFQKFGPLGFTARHWFGDLAEAARAVPHKPLAVCAVGAQEFVREITSLAGPAVPVLTSPELAAQCLAALWRCAKYRQTTAEISL